MLSISFMLGILRATLNYSWAILAILISRPCFDVLYESFAEVSTSGFRSSLTSFLSSCSCDMYREYSYMAYQSFQLHNHHISSQPSSIPKTMLLVWVDLSFFSVRITDAQISILFYIASTSTCWFRASYFPGSSLLQFLHYYSLPRSSHSSSFLWCHGCLHIMQFSLPIRSSLFLYLIELLYIWRAFFISCVFQFNCIPTIYNYSISFRLVPIINWTKLP